MLAYAFAQSPTTQVGVCDIDICGPSIPRMMGAENQSIHSSSSGWSPVYVADNLGVMSIQFMLPGQDDAIIWRGPKKNGLIKQFLKDVEWGDLDWLLVDTPPGTSDEHLSVCSYLKSSGVDGAVVVTTPQEVSLLDVRKEIDFCRKAGIKVLGVVENMSGFVCPNCAVCPLYNSLPFPHSNLLTFSICRANHRSFTQLQAAPARYARKWEFPSSVLFH